MKKSGITGSQGKICLVRTQKKVVHDLGSLVWHLYLMDLIKKGKKTKKINRQNAGKQERPLEMNGNRAPQKGTSTACKFRGVCKVVCRIMFLPCFHLPCGSWLDVAWEGAACAGGLSLPGQERLTRAGVGKSVFSRLLLQRHTLRKDTKEVWLLLLMVTISVTTK